MIFLSHFFIKVSGSQTSTIGTTPNKDQDFSYNFSGNDYFFLHFANLSLDTPHK
jgi:hypothetical protein